ncbi:hypothetical protein I4U23_030889 [Adineta vaga]|nr:hypothetical protein I4U23_030889 [Adineta vaga]
MRNTMREFPFLLSILSIILPPIVALIKVGCTQTFLFNVLLTLCGFIPGIVHALYLVWSTRSQ